MKDLRRLCLVGVLQLLTCLCALAQGDAPSVRGRVADAQGVAVGFATVVLKRVGDAAILASGISNEAGSFALEIPLKHRSDSYVVEVHHLLYKTYTSAPIAESSLLQEELAVRLEGKENILATVTVEGSKPIVERVGNALHYNISSQAHLKGRNLGDILGNLPGVSLPPTGGLQVFGRGGAVVFLNDAVKPLTGRELQTFLNSMDHSMIESIEIMPSASAETEAGFSSIIRIHTKTRMPALYTAQTLRYEHAIKPGVQLSSFMTTPLKGSDFNFFASYTKQNRFEFLEYERSGGNELFTQETEHRIQPQTLILEPTLRHAFKNKSSLVVYGKLGVIDERIETTGNSLLSGSGELLNRNTTRNRSDKLTAGALYSLPIPARGEHKRRMSLALDFSDNHLPSRYSNFSGLATSGEGAAEPFFQLETRPDAQLRLLIGKMDLVEERKNVAFKAGAKATDILYQNQFDLLPVLNSGWVRDSIDFNRYGYEERTLAAYASITLKPRKGVDATFGIRGEHSRLENDFDSKPRSLDTTYFQLFPSVNIAYTSEKGNVLGYNLTRRINRPNFNQLNPTLFLTDPYTYMQGNVTLLPQFSTLHEFFFLFRKKSVFSLSHTAVDQFIAQLPVQRGPYLSLSPENFPSRSSWTLYGSNQLALVSWWQLNGDASISRVTLRFREEARTAFAYRLGLRQNLTLPKSFRANLDWQYTSPGMNGVFEQAPYSVLNLGLRRSFFSQKLHVGIGLQDVFSSQRVRNSFVSTGERVLLKQRTNSRLFSFSINYVFNGTQGKRIGRQADEEFQRL